MEYTQTCVGRVSVATFVLFMFALGCDRGEGGPPCVSSTNPPESSDPQPEYSFSPSEIGEIVFGEWSGSYPGGDFLPQFDFTLTAAGADGDAQYGYVLGAGETVTDDDVMQCAEVDTPAALKLNVSTTAEMPAKIAPETNMVSVRGTDLSRDWNGTSLRGVPYAVFEYSELEHDAGELVTKGNDQMIVAFAANGEMWINDGLSPFKLAGTKQQ